MQTQAISAKVAAMSSKHLTPAVVEAWANLVRTERTLLDKVEEDLKRAQLPPIDWYHVLVERRQCPIDARNNVLLITARGRALRRSMWPVYAAAIEAHFGAHLSQGDAEQLAHLLGKLVRTGAE